MNLSDAQPCCLCGAMAAPAETASIRCNVRRFRERQFMVWRCAACNSLHSEPVNDLAAYYADYPIRNEKLDYFLRIWYGIILKRLRMLGLEKHHRFLDYGCNKGLFLRYLKEQGYLNGTGYDLYVPEFSNREALDQKYDFVISLDVIEHDPDPKAFFTTLQQLLAPAGTLVIETPNADGIDLKNPEEYLHALHLPYHVHLLSQRALQRLGEEGGLKQVATYLQWYSDAPWPATSRRLIERLLFFGGNDIDLGYEPPRIDLFFKHPSLIWDLFFGYLHRPRKTDHMMLAFKTA